jgi:outer membrane protein assembly factor BamE (lipoprotein component of BamABCDE complex)
MKYKLPHNLNRFCLIIVIISSLTCASCGFIPFYAQGKKFNPNNTAELIRGKSTRVDVLRLFGEPLETSVANPGGSDWWRYGYVYLGDLGVERADLEIEFKGDIVMDYQLRVTDSRS